MKALEAYVNALSLRAHVIACGSARSKAFEAHNEEKQVLTLGLVGLVLYAIWWVKYTISKQSSD